MLRIFASNKNTATPADDFAAGTSRFYRSPYSHPVRNRTQTQKARHVLDYCL